MHVRKTLYFKTRGSVGWTCAAVLRNLYTEPSIGASYHIAVHLATWFQRRRFFGNQPIRNKNCLWWPCLITNRAEMNKLYIEDLPYMLPTKFWFIWPSGFRGEDLLESNQSEKKDCLWQPCLLTDRDEMNNLYRGRYINASYQVSGHLAKGFQRRRLKCKKFTDGCQVMTHVTIGTVS